MKHLRPRKALGQAFLTHEPTADALVEALNVSSSDVVLEIGPGKGALTRRLARVAARVIAVEIDARLVQLLRTELPEVETIHADFLVWDPPGLDRLLVIGNLPYNLSSQILLRLLDQTYWRRAVLTTQREFAERVLGQPGTKSYGALTVFCDRLVTKHRLFNIPASRFKPTPDVVSTAFTLVRRDQPSFEINDTALFRRVVRAAFNQRRKTILNSLSAALGLHRQTILQALSRAGIRPELRAECVEPPGFQALVLALAELLSTSSQ
ncbi:MAG: 16S rRNA (adenine(1518)-N(6)/adenine(1519)-N(6))-dimethyltransferase RsmA [candidate division WOR-3 bacterium]